jgi:hypothetical protein
MEPNKRFDHVFAIIRIDEFRNPDVPVEDRVVVQKIMWNEQAAEKELDRLNNLKPGGRSRYCLQIARIERAAKAVESVLLLEQTMVVRLPDTPKQEDTKTMFNPEIKINRLDAVSQPPQVVFTQLVG